MKDGLKCNGILRSPNIEPKARATRCFFRFCRKISKKMMFHHIIPLVVCVFFSRNWTPSFSPGFVLKVGPKKQNLPKTLGVDKVDAEIHQLWQMDMSFSQRQILFQ